jgi:hypothetical protein
VRHKNVQVDIYRAVIVTGLKRPYSIMFRNLKKSEEILLIEKNRLEVALSQIRTLSGLLPICANCKKIRDDQGYWNQIETYIHDHSDAKFSHGICPECCKKLYCGTAGEFGFNFYKIKIDNSLLFAAKPVEDRSG